MNISLVENTVFYRKTIALPQKPSQMALTLAKNPLSLHPTLRKTLLPLGLELLLITTIISFRWLFDDNMGMVNEVDVLPFARQHASPNWLSQDWYLNQPAGYRLPFIAMFGTMAALVGFLATSVIGRLFCYVWVASGWLALRRVLHLRLVLFLLSLILFLYLDQYIAAHITTGEYAEQGAAAHEWLVGALEPKAIAYGFVLWAIALLLSGRYLWTALMLGCATSLHTLVGGWAFLVTLGWLLWKRQLPLRPLVLNGWFLLLYGIASVFSIQPILQQLTEPAPASPIAASFAYVFLRSPHHLNPLSWNADWWVKPLVCLVILMSSLVALRRTQSTTTRTEQAVEFAQFALLSLLPFGLGLAIAPFDQQGQFLQYYPFRLGDVLLPMTAYLLLACALQQCCQTAFSQRVLRSVCLLVMAILLSLQVNMFSKDVDEFLNFPGEDHAVDVELENLCNWVKVNTEKQAIVISPPAEMPSFNWLCERATIAKYKFIPPTQASVAQWLERLDDLSGADNPWADLSRTEDHRDRIRDRLTEGYNNLDTRAVRALMEKYQADYFLTQRDHRLNLPTAYRNRQYILYTTKPSQ